MDQIPQILVAVLVVVLVLALVVRFVRGMPGRVRKARRPESRSIRVVGVGGGGSNAVDRMVEANMSGVDFVACNTDAQALRQSLATTKLRIGDAITHGLGSGGDPAVGRRAAEDDARRIGKTLAGADLVFVSAGLGGGTGSGAAPVISAKAREHGALTIAVVTKPFAFEGAKRRRVADEAADELRSQVDALITIPNDRIAGVMPAEASMIEAFRAVDAILADAVQGVIELLTSPGLVNVDFADVRAVMQDDGPAALIGLGRGSGPGRAAEAARSATTSPLLEGNIRGARGILFNISGSSSLRLQEVTQAAEEIRAAADPDANIIFGTSVSEALGDEVVITLIATGLDGATSEPAVAAPTPAMPSAVTKRAARSRPIPEPVAQEAVPPAAAAAPAVAETATPAPPPQVDESDLEVPSFLRRGRPPSSRPG